jgi:hypothetical protein
MVEGHREPIARIGGNASHKEKIAHLVFGGPKQQKDDLARCIVDTPEKAHLPGAAPKPVMMAAIDLKELTLPGISLSPPAYGRAAAPSSFPDPFLLEQPIQRRTADLKTLVEPEHFGEMTRVEQVVPATFARQLLYPGYSSRIRFMDRRSAGIPMNQTGYTHLQKTSLAPANRANAATHQTSCLF